MSDFGELMRSELDRHGFTLRAACRAMHNRDPAFPSRVMNGANPSRALAEDLDELLGTTKFTKAFAAAVKTKTSPPPVPTDSGAHWERQPAAFHHTTANAEDLRRIDQARVHFQEMYRRVGGVPTSPRISAVLDQRVAPMLRATYDNEFGRRLFRSAGSLTAFAGICAYDADQQMAATARFAEALSLARTSGDIQFEGYLHALLANQAMHLGDMGQVFHHTTNVLDYLGSQLNPALKCDLHSIAAKAYARIGSVTACHHHLAAAADNVDRGWNGPELPETSYVTPGLIELQTAEALRRLGDTNAALSYAEESIRTTAQTHLRGRVHRWAGYALVLTAQGEIEHAAAAAETMLDQVIGMESGRLHDRIASVTSALRPYSAQRQVAGTLERAEVQLAEPGT